MLPEEEGHGISVPWYAAGFFLHPTWVNIFMEEHKVKTRLDDYIRQLPAAKALDVSFEIITYCDEDHCVFLSLHDNIVDGGVKTENWLRRREEQFDLVCTLLQLTEEQVGMAKANFAWHLMRSPRVYDCVPANITLHIPSKLKEHRFYAH